jgi:hypothetical protein
VIKISPRRPKRLFKGSEIQTPSKADEMYGAALTKPTIHSSLSPAGVPTGLSRPNSAGKDRSGHELDD